MTPEHLEGYIELLISKGWDDCLLTMPLNVRDAVEQQGVIFEAFRAGYTRALLDHKAITAYVEVSK